MEMISAMRLPLQQDSMPTLNYAFIVGKLLSAGALRNMRFDAVLHDNASCIELVDSALLGVPSALLKCQREDVPFFKHVAPLQGFKDSPWYFGASHVGCYYLG